MKNMDKVTLPSNGLLDAPSEVTIRGMKGKEISTLFSSLTEAAVEEIIMNVTEPSLDPDTLCDEDKHFILHKTRVLTFGNEVEQSLRCPFCGHVDNYVLNYEDFDTTLLDEEAFNEVIEMEDGEKLKKQIPTKDTWGAIKRHKDKRNLSEGYAFLLLQAAKIDKIDGKKKTISELVSYLEDLPGNELMKLSRKLELDFGLDTEFKVNCKGCHTDFTGGVGINADMFRQPD